MLVKGTAMSSCSHFFHWYSEMALVVSLFQEVTEKIVNNKALLNESQEMVLAQLPETLNAQTQSGMQVICTGARRKVSHFQNGTTGKLRGGKGTRFCEMREDKRGAAPMQQRADVSARVWDEGDKEQKQRTNACFQVVALQVWREVARCHESVLRKCWSVHGSHPLKTYGLKFLYF